MAGTLQWRKKFHDFLSKDVEEKDIISLKDEGQNLADRYDVTTIFFSFGKTPFGKMPFGKMPFGKMPFGKMPFGTNVNWTNVNRPSAIC